MQTGLQYYFGKATLPVNLVCEPSNMQPQVRLRMTCDARLHHLLRNVSA